MGGTAKRSYPRGEGDSHIKRREVLVILFGD